jgi:Protein of unknown function (DUF3995)
MESCGGPPTLPAMTTTTGTIIGGRVRRTAMPAFWWTAVFILWHGYWALGGDFGFGDQQSGFPDTTSSAAGWAFTVPVVGMFVAGLAVPLALARGTGPRRLLVGLMWAGAAVLVARGAIGLLDDALRFTGLAETGVSGLSDEQVLGTADPSAYTIWSTVGLDAFFALGGLLFAYGARRTRRVMSRPAAIRRSRAHRPRPTLAWAAYAAAGLAIGYAVGVRGYQGLGGTIGLPGTFEDPAGFRRASLTAGAFLVLVGVGALAFVRPWGLRLPRWLVIVPALAGSAYAIAHALTAYVTKTLDLAGAIDLHLDGWARLDETKLFLWDFLFYEPWFLALGVLVTLGALHHHRRTGGSARAGRRLLVAAAAASVALAAISSVLVVVRFA